MNYLKLKQKIYEAIERNPLDRSAYEEMFVILRTPEMTSVLCRLLRCTEARSTS